MTPHLLRPLIAALALLACAVTASAQSTGPAGPETLTPVTTASPEGQALLARLRQGGLILYFRHADTIGMPCDRTFRIGDREGQRNISARGQEQSRAIGRAFAAERIPIDLPVLAGPVFRARDTAELAFGVERTRVVEALTADDYAGGRLTEVLAGLRGFMTTPPPAGTNRVLVGHIMPAVMLIGRSVSGRAFPEGSAIVLEPNPTAPRAIGVWMPAPIEGGGFHTC